ncbi:MAG: sensor histidine kinase [Suipraeoptans sp.]
MQRSMSKYIEYTMLLFNIFVVVLLSAFMYSTTWNIVSNNDAKSFLEQVNAIPGNSGYILYINYILITILFISYCCRETIFKDNIAFQSISLATDFIISLIIVYLLGFNYNGILLWVFANTISKLKQSREKYGIIIVALVSYVITSQGLIGLNRNIYSLNDYIQYYDIRIQRYLTGIYTIITSFNIILFIIYCVYILLVQMGALSQIQHLNRKLTSTNEQLLKANSKLQNYADIKEKMGETKERNRLAREIHDTLGHTLTGISAGIDACIATIDLSPEDTKRQLTVISQVTRDGIDEVRQSVSELRPDALERLNLSSAIESMISKFESMTKVKIHYQNEIQKLKFDTDEEDAIYRVIQESITNSVRHGAADNIYVNISKQYSDIEITIQDDGKGAPNFVKGFGTKHIIERVGLLNGKVNFDGSDGFKTEVCIPIRWGEEYD